MLPLRQQLEKTKQNSTRLVATQPIDFLTEFGFVLMQNVAGTFAAIFAHHAPLPQSGT